MALELCG